MTDGRTDGRMHSKNVTSFYYENMFSKVGFPVEEKKHIFRVSAEVTGR